MKKSEKRLTRKCVVLAKNATVVVQKLLFWGCNSMQDVSVADSMKYPRLYVPGPLNLLFNKRIFMYCIIEGIVSSLVLFFVPLGTFHLASRPDGLDLAGHKAFGFTIASILIVAVTLRVSIKIAL